LSVDWESVLASIVPIVVGIAIGFLLTPLAEMWSSRRKRRRLAVLLGPEVETIRVMAEQSVTAHESTVRAVRESVARGGSPFEFLATKDVDYPTRVYDSHLTDIDLFDEALASSLTNLYRWTSIAHYWKGEELAHYSEFMGMARFFAVSGVPVSEPARGYLVEVQKAMLTVAEAYLRVQRRIVSFAREAGAEISRASGQPVPKIDLSLGEDSAPK